MFKINLILFILMAMVFAAGCAPPADEPKEAEKLEEEKIEEKKEASST